MKASEKKPNYDGYMTMQEYVAKEKIKAEKELPKAKAVESQRNKEGFVYMTSLDGRTKVQTKRIEYYKKLGYVLI